MVGSLPAVSYKLQLEGNRCKLCVRTCVGSPYGRDYYQAYSKACACHTLDDDEQLIDRPRFYSFPSGHTTASFAMVGVALMRCKVITFMPILMLAMLIAFSRIYLRVHYLTDVIAGMILGLTCGICSVLIFNTVVPMWFPMV